MATPQALMAWLSDPASIKKQLDAAEETAREHIYQGVLWAGKWLAVLLNVSLGRALVVLLAAFLALHALRLLWRMCSGFWVPTIRVEPASEGIRNACLRAHAGGRRARGEVPVAGRSPAHRCPLPTPVAAAGCSHNPSRSRGQKHLQQRRTVRPERKARQGRGPVL